MVEFALVAPIVFGLMFGVFHMGLLYMKYQQVGFAASEGARCAAVARNGNRPACAPSATSPQAAARLRAKAKAPNLGLADSDVAVSSTTGYALPGTVSVTVRHDVSLPLLAGFGGADTTAFTLRATSTSKLEG